MYSEILSKLIIKKIYSVSTMYGESGRILRRNNRSNWAIVIKYEGETIYTNNGKKFLSNIENMIILPKGITYEMQCLKAGHFSIIEFESDIEHNKILPFPLKNAEKILELFRKMEYKRNLKGPMYELECIETTYSIIIQLAKESSRKYMPNTKQQKLVPAIDYIAENYAKKIKNEDLAALTGFSTDYFRKIFTQVYGISPIEYIHKLRIKKAKELLNSDYISITDIAVSLGYENIYDFSRSFKKATGISPSKYKL